MVLLQISRDNIGFGTVKEPKFIYNSTMYVVIRLDNEKNEDIRCYYTKDVIPDTIWDSPLYKTLKEV